MAAPLSVCTKKEQRSVIRFLWSEGVSGAAINQKLSAQYGNSALPQRVSIIDWKIKKWSHKYYAWQRSRTTVYGHHWAYTWHGPVRRETIDEVANFLKISHGSAYEMMHNKLGFHKVCARWVLKQLAEVHKQTRVDIWQKHLDCYGNERDNFLDRIITGDETWVHIYEPESKRQSMQWKHPQSPCKKKFKTQPFTAKLMLTVFWDSQGPILEHYQERRTTIDSAR